MKAKQKRELGHLLPCASASATPAEMQAALEKLTKDFYFGLVGYLAIAILILFLLYKLGNKIKNRALRIFILIIGVIFFFQVLFAGVFYGFTHNPYKGRDINNIGCFDPVVKYLDTPYN